MVPSTQRYERREGGGQLVRCPPSWRDRGLAVRRRHPGLHPERHLLQLDAGEAVDTPGGVDGRTEERARIREGSGKVLDCGRENQHRNPLVHRFRCEGPIDRHFRDSRVGDWRIFRN